MFKLFISTHWDLGGRVSRHRTVWYVANSPSDCRHGIEAALKAVADKYGIAITIRRCTVWYVANSPSDCVWIVPGTYEEME